MSCEGLTPLTMWLAQGLATFANSNPLRTAPRHAIVHVCFMRAQCKKKGFVQPQHHHRKQQTLITEWHSRCSNQSTVTTCLTPMSLNAYNAATNDGSAASAPKTRLSSAVSNPSTSRVTAVTMFGRHLRPPCRI